MAGNLLQTIWLKNTKRARSLLKKMSPSRRVVTLAAAGLGALVIIYLVFVLAYSGRVFPQVMVGDVSFGGLRTSAVAGRLSELAAANKDKPIRLNYADKVSSINPGDISWQLDATTTANQIVAVGRNHSWGQRILEQIAAPFARHRIAPTVSYNSELLTNFLANITDTIDEPAVNASARFVGDKLIITHEQVGKAVNRAEIEAVILGAWAGFQTSEVKMETAFDAPDVVLGDETELRSKVETLQQTALTLKWADSTKVLNKAEISQLIGFTPGPSNSNQATLQAAFTAEAVKNYLSVLANGSINAPAKDPKLIIKDGVLAVGQASSAGRTVDLEASTVSVLAILQSTGANKTAELTLKTQEPNITEANLASLGIKERIGFGETSFAGSPANRIHNIRNGVSLLQSALIKPGDVFSTVSTLGAVDDTTGFLPELVIKENKTTPEFGGGLCQVSTTLFRTVMNAGLKVTERQNHSYRVSYYEPPVGLDATIYLPKPDFKFLNDTPGHLLLQGRVERNKVIFELWGSSDGRVSSISTPQILSTTPPGDPIYADTDTLFKGETKQIEKAHDGAVAVATYTVTRNGAVINKQTFKSIYKVWPARFLVGTKEPPAPADPPPPTP